MEEVDAKIHQNTPEGQKEVEVEPLEKRYADAIELKFMSQTYEVIADKVGVTKDTVKSWFREGGLLFEKYYQYAEKRQKEKEEEQKERARTAKNALDAQIINAVAVINNALLGRTIKTYKCAHCSKDNSVEINLPIGASLTAALEVINRVFGKTTENISFTGKLETNPYKHLTIDELKREIEDTERRIAGEGEPTGDGEIRV